MRIRKPDKLCLCGWALAVCVIICGCNERKTTPPTASQPATQSAESLCIAVAPKGVPREFWSAVHAGAVKAGLELKNSRIIWKEPFDDNDHAAQISTIKEFINTGVSGIVLAPLDRAAPADVVAEARKADIPTVIVDSDLDGQAGTDYVSLVATDNYAGGLKAARHLAKLLEGGGNVLLLRHMAGSANTNNREQGFLDALAKDYPDINVVSSDQYAGPTLETAKAKAESLLADFPELAGIFCSNDTSALGMLIALQESGRAGNVKFMAFDAASQLVKALQDGQVHGLIVQDPFNIGYLAVKAVAARLRGKEVPPRIDTGSAVVTPENMNEPRIKQLLSPPLEKYLGSEEFQN